ncbi:hypothetical protein CERSUDRAFT_98881 [Gelatoporia subvermispora B]|uniref:Uncharacterized protein n=1 Tax=Ceriporiopsis subvermispora (strain B) TaxID=914234 RepID=M2R1V9_CERS8|nr:hypothetical protein CERSUDRAFT_98881 [Gelatoporia subvermispora B]
MLTSHTIRNSTDAPPHLQGRTSNIDDRPPAKYRDVDIRTPRSTFPRPGPATARQAQNAGGGARGAHAAQLPRARLDKDEMDKSTHQNKSTEFGLAYKSRPGVSPPTLPPPLTSCQSTRSPKLTSYSSPTAHAPRKGGPHNEHTPGREHSEPYIHADHRGRMFTRLSSPARAPARMPMSSPL